MKYILIGSILGSLITSSHENEEACRGRQEMIRKEYKINSECYKEPSSATGVWTTNPGIRLCNNGVC